MLWFEYAPNSLVLAASGVPPFKASLVYQLPLFDRQEEEVASHLSKRTFVFAQVQRQMNHRRAPTQVYQPGQRV